MPEAERAGDVKERPSASRIGRPNERQALAVFPFSGRSLFFFYRTHAPAIACSPAVWRNAGRNFVVEFPYVSPVRTATGKHSSHGRDAVLSPSPSPGGALAAHGVVDQSRPQPAAWPVVPRPCATLDCQPRQSPCNAMKSLPSATREPAAHPTSAWGHHSHRVRRHALRWSTSSRRI